MVMNGKLAGKSELETDESTGVTLENSHLSTVFLGVLLRSSGASNIDTNA